MRHVGILSLALSATLLPLGCGADTSSTSDVSNAKDKIGEAADATAVAARAKRDEFAHYLQKQLDEFDARYKELEKRAAEAEGDAKKDLEKKLAEAKPRREAAARKLEEVKAASHDRWEKIKDGVGSAFDDLKKAVE
jgi:predicted  nucleic acid-binding Zn-ribbon protein